MALHETYNTSTSISSTPEITISGIGQSSIVFGLLLLLGAGWQYAQFTTTQFEQTAQLPSGEESAVHKVTNSATVIGDTENKLVIYSIGVDAEIIEGGIESLAKGVWRMPRTSTPDVGGNTVFSAHRWMYDKDHPSSFFDLDEVMVGQDIMVVWEGVQYRYEVFEIFEVTPDQVEILAPSTESIVTLFTCTPVYSTSKRLVVRARLVE